MVTYLLLIVLIPNFLLSWLRTSEYDYRIRTTHSSVGIDVSWCSCVSDVEYGRPSRTVGGIYGWSNLHTLACGLRINHLIPLSMGVPELVGPSPLQVDIQYVHHVPYLHSMEGVRVEVMPRGGFRSYLTSPEDWVVSWVDRPIGLTI